MYDVMKATSILGIVLGVFIISCSSDQKESEVSATESLIYKISDLPESPAFAKPISKAGEERKFILVKKDGTALSFNLKSVEETLFGEKRVLIGTAVKDKNEPENAIMIVGKNGFELYFQEKEEKLVLKSKNELDLGIKEIDLNFDKQNKKDFLDAAKKIGYDGEVLLRNYTSQKSSKKSNSKDYNVIIEKSKRYDLINETATLANKKSVEGEKPGECSSILPAPNGSFNQMKLNSAKGNERKTYNMEIVYMENTTPYLALYVSVIYSFMELGGKLGLKKEGYNQVPNLSLYTPEDTPAAKAEYLAAFLKVPIAKNQLTKLKDYVKSHPNKLGKKVVRCALYTDNSWDNNNTGGASYLDTYNNTSYGAELSSLIASDAFYNILAHECGHNLGAVHVANSLDVMYMYASNPLTHLDAGNLRILKSCIGERW